VLGRWAFFLILKGNHCDLQKNVLPPLEPKLLVMWEKIGGVLKMVYSTYQFTKTWF
jgi:hypothetical protein